MKMKGMHGQILSVDLTQSHIEKLCIENEMLTQYLGGRGLGVKLFTSRVNATTDSLSPQNHLVFTTGPLTGSIVPTSGRFSLVTKSPLTGFILYSNTGGFVGQALKTDGYDGLIVCGKLERPEPGAAERP